MPPPDTPRWVTSGYEVMLSTAQGQTVRTGCNDIRIAGRNTQGVKLLTLNEGDILVAIARVITEQQEEAAEAGSEKKLPPMHADRL